MIDKKRVLIASLTYSTGVTFAAVFANAFIAPKMDLPGATGMSLADITLLVLFAFPICFAFLALIFSFASWSENRSSKE